MNFGTPVPLLLGIFLILGAVALFFLDRLRPGYERDYDKVYAVLFLLSGIFLLGHLTMELLPSFQQLIMVGALTALMIQDIRSRAPNANIGRAAGRQAAPEVPPKDSYRPSRGGRSSYGMAPQTSVRAEIDRRDLPPERPYRPMLGSYDEQASSRSDYRQDSYRDQSYSDKPYSDKPYSDKPYSDQSYSDKPYSDKPYSDQSYSDKPYSDKPYSDQSYSGQSYSDQSYSDQSYSDKPYSGQSYPDRYGAEDSSPEGRDSRMDDSYYSSNPRPDVRIRRRRPSKYRNGL